MCKSLYGGGALSGGRVDEVSIALVGARGVVRRHLAGDAGLGRRAPQRREVVHAPTPREAALAGRGEGVERRRGRVGGRGAEAVEAGAVQLEVLGEGHVDGRGEGGRGRREAAGAAAGGVDGDPPHLVLEGIHGCGGGGGELQW